MKRSRRERIASALGVAVVHGAIGYALIAGLRARSTVAAADTFAVYDLTIELPPPVPEELPKASEPRPADEGAAAPPDLVAEPSPVVAPPPPVRLVAPPPIVAAPAPGPGSDASAGASDIAGPGTGAGGEGVGTGSGGSGDGMGAGGMGGGSPAVTRARHIAGRIRNADYPRGAGDVGAQGTVVVHFDVDTEGRPRRCRVVDTSGNAELDATTCRIVERRFRYEPARGAAGRAVPDVMGWKEVWWIGSRRPRMVGEVEAED